VGTYSLSNGASFYKYEPFSFTFSGGSASNFSAAGTLVGFCSSNNSVATPFLVFAATNGTQTGTTPPSTAGDTLAVSYTVRGSSYTNYYTLFLNAGRFTISPTISNSAIVLYLSEPVLYTFTSVIPLTSSNVTPSLPAGIYFDQSNTSNWLLTSRSSYPAYTSVSSNYVFLGTDASNRSVFTSLSIQILGERLTMSSSSALSNITLNTSSSTPIQSPTLFNNNYSRRATSVKYTLPSLPPGLAYSNLAGVQKSGSYTTTVLGSNDGIYVYGVPTTTGLTTNSPSNVAVTVTTTVTGVSTLSASSTLNFTYSPVLIFTSPSTSAFTVYSNVPISNIPVSAAVQFGNATTVTYTALNLPTGLVLVSNAIQGTPTATPGTYTATITATGGTLTASNVLTFTVSNVPVFVTPNVTTLQTFTVARSLANPLSGSYVYPITFTLSSPAYSGSNWIASSSLSVSNGVTYTLSGTTATLNGTPQQVSSGTLNFTVTTTDGTAKSGGFPYAIIPDVFTFSTTTPMPFVFTQNIPITPIQFFATTLSTTPVTNFTPSSTPLPIGLTISATGQLQGTPAVAGTGYILTNATNGYVTASMPTNQFLYTILPDVLHLTSTATLFPLTGTVNIPLTISTLSGLFPATLTSLNYLYGLTLSPTTPFKITGNVVNTVAVPASTVITLLGSNSIGGITTTQTTQVQILASNIPTINRYTIRRTNKGYTVFSSSNLFSYASNSPVSSNTTTLLDFQSGGGTAFYVDNTSNIRNPDGTIAYTGLGVIFNQIAYMSTTLQWYAFAIGGSAVSTYVYSVGNPWTPVGLTITPATPLAARTDGGYVMRTIGSNLILGGSNGIYYASVSGVTTTYTPSDSTLTNVTAISTTGPTLVATGTPGIQYSINSGSNWLTATNGFSVGGYDVQYGGVSGNQCWVAIGSNTSGPSLKYSSNATSWIDIALPSSVVALGPMNFDGTNWSVFFTTRATPTLTGTSDTSFSVYQHDVLVSTMSNASTWFTSQATFATTDTLSTTTSLSTFPVPLITSNGTPLLTLSVGVTTTGPTFRLPSATAYMLYQYIPVVAIPFDAGAGVSYFFDTTILPPGMQWTTNIPSGTNGYYTAAISGYSVQLGTFPLTVYAQSSTGQTAITITLTVSRLFPTTDHTSVSAYTSFVREKVIADAATNSVKNKVVPSVVGTFLLDDPKDPPIVPEICCTTGVKRIS